MIEYDIRFNINYKELNNLDLKYIIKTYESTIKEIPICNKEEDNKILNKIEINLENINYSKINILNLIKSNNLIKSYDFICLLININDIHIIKNYPIQFIKFNLTERQIFKRGLIIDLLYEYKKYIEISFKHFLINKEIFLENLINLMEITKGKGLIFTSECKRITEFKGFSEKFSLFMSTVLNYNNKYNIKPIYTNQLEMENYHLKVFYELIKKKCLNKFNVINNNNKISNILINDKILPYFN